MAAPKGAAIFDIGQKGIVTQQKSQFSVFSFQLIVVILRLVIETITLFFH